MKAYFFKSEVLVRLTGLLFATCVALTSGAADKEMGVESFIYVGTRTDKDSQAKGIYLFRMRTSDDPNIPEFVTVTPLGVVAECASPTFLEIDSRRNRLFCVNQVEHFEDKPSGAVSAYSIDPVSGKLSLLNQRGSMGAGPCHLVLDKEGKHLLVANGDGGNVAILPIDSEGKLGEATDVKSLVAESDPPDKTRNPRPSGVAFSPDNRYAFACDAVRDRISVFQFDPAGGRLKPADPPFVKVKAGSGPHHLLFRSDAKFAYLNNQMNSTVTAFQYDAQNGGLIELQSLPTVPPYYDGPNTTSEIALHPTGKNLLVANCGHNSIVLFNVDSRDGTLTYVEDQSTYGTVPRHFSFDARGKHAVVANEGSGSILILRAPENARVKPAGNVVNTPSPTCAKFLLHQ